MGVMAVLILSRYFRLARVKTLKHKYGKVGIESPGFTYKPQVIFFFVDSNFQTNPLW